MLVEFLQSHATKFTDQFPVSVEFLLTHATQFTDQFPMIVENFYWPMLPSLLINFHW